MHWPGQMERLTLCTYVTTPGGETTKTVVKKDRLKLMSFGYFWHLIIVKRFMFVIEAKYVQTVVL